ncbi:hypothetical protein, partial [Klebsiella sp. C-Nf10]|uniref:hypothetical protein n=1 Tax=Klebsiella sp. C-Nf10 TaxID=2054605 RepID=UPI00197E6B4E
GYKPELTGSPDKAPAAIREYPPRWRCAYRGYKPGLTGSPDKAPAAIREYPSPVALCLPGLQTGADG